MKSGLPIAVTRTEESPLPAGGVLEAIKEGRITRKELLDRGRGGTSISLWVSRELKEALKELVDHLRSLGYPFRSVNDFIVRLLAELVLSYAGAEAEEGQQLVINVTVTPNVTRVTPVVTPSTEERTERAEIPEELKSAIRLATQALRKAPTIHADEALRLLEDAYQRLLPFGSYGIAQHFLSVLEAEMNRIERMRGGVARD